MKARGGRGQGGIRIIAGRYRGRRLSCPGGLETRPTGGLVRGALFNMLGGLVEGAQVLELYAGTGALGLEALSRGAEHAVLVEGDRRAVEVLRGNVAALGAGEAADIVAMDCLSYLDRCRSQFDLVLADPPYAEDLTEPLLARMRQRGILSVDGVAVIQEPAQRPLRRGAGTLGLWKSRSHGRTRLALYRNEMEE